MLRLHTFGGCFLTRDGARLDTASAHRKGLALLAVLAAAGERGVSRDTIVALLWPDSDDERARTSLRQLLHSLRNQLKAPSLFAAPPELRLDPAVITSDVGDFRRALAEGDHAAAATLFTGSFLDGFYLKDAGELERWVAAERGALANAAARAVETLAENAERRGDPHEALIWWRRSTELEPLSARAAIGLMRALDATGERAAALQHARVHELLLEQEVGEAADASVTAFANTLRGSPPARVAATPPPVLAEEAPPAAPELVPERRSRIAMLTAIALAVVVATVIGLAAIWPRNAHSASLLVLPLSNTSGDVADDAISDGLTDNLIAALAAVPELRVISRTSAFQFKRRALDVRAIADSLNVQAVLDGSLQRAGQRMKINVQLVSARDGVILWTQSYDREISDFFAVQDEITTAIVGALRVRLVDTSPAGTSPRTLRDVAAYELYLRGRQIFSSRTDREAAYQAKRYFDDALARDSTLAHAHAGLSDVYMRLAIFAHMPAREGFTLAKAAALRALALDSTIAEAHTALGHTLCVAEFDWAGGERALKRAIAINPTYTFGRMPYAICLMMQSRFREAEQQLREAQSFDPLSPAPDNLLGRLFVMQRQPDRAIPHLRQTLELSPNMDLAWQQLGHAYVQKSMHDEAIKAFERAAALSGARDSAHLAYAFARAGRADEAHRIVDRLQSLRGRESELAYHIALALTGLGEHDDAFAWLDRGAETLGSFMIGLKTDPAFEPLRGDPRWRPLVRRMGLE